VQVHSGWRRRLGPDALGPAIGEAARAAAAARLETWGETFGEPVDEPAPALTGDSFAEQLQAVATKRMSGEDVRASLLELLDMAERLEQGIDQVSRQLNATVDATHTGRSTDRKVTVTVTGGGDVAEVRFDQRWLQTAHEINIGRQTLSAFEAAYREASASGVDQLIAGSGIGEVLRESQDPFGLARRLRLRD
jgi:DNA-binding protein YbaB